MQNKINLNNLVAHQCLCEQKNQSKFFVYSSITWMIKLNFSQIQKAETSHYSLTFFIATPQ